MRYLLDTDHISILQRQTGMDYARLTARIARHRPTEVAFSIISFHEQTIGCHAYINQARRTRDILHGYEMLARVLQDFAAAPVIPFDAAAATNFEQLQAQQVRVATMDLRIAATALSRGLVLLTRNARDFSKVPSLQIENWTV